MISREEALNLLVEHLSGEKRKHSVLVSKIMKKLAENFGENKTKWELTGLLHDLDYEITRGAREQHGIIAAKMLEGRLSEDCLHAIMAHDHRTGVKPVTLIDKALIVSDMIAVLISEVASRIGYERIPRMKMDDIKEELKRELLFKEKLGVGLVKICKELDLTLEGLIKLAVESLIEDQNQG
ncbi:MAG: hypothetical protein DRN92_03345 [Thermoproteota archaeon]|nr:MAG: hypothetical protein DRN92_03345 [Candidatus Korarchaeota archaeon]